MSNDVVVVPVLQTIPQPTFGRSTPDRWFFSSMGVAAALTVFWGFAPTYYLRTSDTPSLPPVLHLHGVVFTAWMVLYVVQTALIAKHHGQVDQLDRNFRMIIAEPPAVDAQGLAEHRFGLLQVPLSPDDICEIAEADGELRVVGR